jgi:hypothetical protein
MILGFVSPGQWFCALLWSPHETCLLSDLASALWRPEMQRHVTKRYHFCLQYVFFMRGLDGLCLVADRSEFFHENIHADPSTITVVMPQV